MVQARARYSRSSTRRDYRLAARTPHEPRWRPREPTLNRGPGGRPTSSATGPARAELHQRRRVERRETTLKAAQAQLEQAQAQLASQGNQARYTTLVADVSRRGHGRRGRAGPGGDGRHAGGADRPGRAARRGVLGARRQGRRAARRPAAWRCASGRGGATLAGKVREVAASADPVTRTYSVKVSLDAAGQPPLGATVSAPGAGPRRAGVIKLPTSALRQEGRATAVWVLDKATHDREIPAGASPRRRQRGRRSRRAAARACWWCRPACTCCRRGQKVTVYGDKAPRGGRGRAASASMAAPRLGPRRSAACRERRSTTAGEAFNLSRWALEHPALTRYLMVVLMLLGVAAYFQLGQDEDPPFTFRAMVVRTYWPGATAQQVAEQVTDKLEKNAAGNAVHRQDPQLFQAGRVADHLPDQGLDAARGRGQRLVPGAQEDRRHPRTLPAGRPGSVLQRRIRRRLRHDLRAGRPTASTTPR